MSTDTKYEEGCEDNISIQYRLLSLITSKHYGLLRTGNSDLLKES